MVTARQDANLVRLNVIHESMFRVDSSRPTAGQLMFERLWLPNTDEWIGLNCLNKPNNPHRLLAIALKSTKRDLQRPMSQIPSFARASSSEMPSLRSLAASS